MLAAVRNPFKVFDPHQWSILYDLFVEGLEWFWGFKIWISFGFEFISTCDLKKVEIVLAGPLRLLFVGVSEACYGHKFWKVLALCLLNHLRLCDHPSTNLFWALSCDLLALKLIGLDLVQTWYIRRGIHLANCELLFNHA